MPGILEVAEQRSADRERRAAAPDGPQTLDGAKLASEVARAVREETRKWKLSSAERDALAGDAVVWLLTARASGRDPLADRERHERIAYLRTRVRSQLRDGNGWRDSLAGATVRDQRKGRKGKRTVALAASVAEQATAYREAERAERPAPFASWGDFTNDDGETVGLLARQIERDALREGLPPASLAEHARELADAVAHVIGRDFNLSPAAFQDCRVALLAASEPLHAVAREQRCSLTTVKRRRDRGNGLLRMLLSARDLAKLRRRCATALDLVPPHDGVALTDAERAALEAVAHGKREAGLRTLAARSAEPTVSASTGRVRLTGSAQRVTLRTLPPLTAYRPTRTFAGRTWDAEERKREALSRNAALRSRAAREQSKRLTAEHAAWMEGATAHRYW